ncbi:hypothetical protein AGLY_006655, partial [Aphis glycines]
MRKNHQIHRFLEENNLDHQNSFAKIFQVWLMNVLYMVPDQDTNCTEVYMWLCQQVGDEVHDVYEKMCLFQHLVHLIEHELHLLIEIQKPLPLLMPTAFGGGDENRLPICVNLFLFVRPSKLLRKFYHIYPKHPKKIIHHIILYINIITLKFIFNIVNDNIFMENISPFSSNITDMHDCFWVIRNCSALVFPCTTGSTASKCDGLATTAKRTFFYIIFSFQCSKLMYNANCTTYQMEGSNHIKSLGAVYHLGRLYLNLKDQGVQYDVLSQKSCTCVRTIMCRKLRTTTNLMTTAEVLGQTENDVKNMENISVLRERERAKKCKNNSKRSDECIDFTMIITSRNNASISNFGGSFRRKSEYPWCIIKFKFLRNLSKTRKFA